MAKWAKMVDSGLRLEVGLGLGLRLEKGLDLGLCLKIGLEQGLHLEIGTESGQHTDTGHEFPKNPGKKREKDRARTVPSADVWSYRSRIIILELLLDTS